MSHPASRLLLVTSLMLALGACGQAPAPERLDSQRFPECPVTESAGLNAQRVPDPCDPGEPGDPGEPTSSAPQVRPWSELENRAAQYGVSLLEAANPYLQAPAAFRAQVLPDTQAQIDGLFVGAPSVWQQTLPPPSADPYDLCSSVLVDYVNDPASGHVLMEEPPTTIWPGALIQGDSLYGGASTMATISVPTNKRVPLTIESDTRFTSTPNVAPDSAGVLGAIGNMFSGASSLGQPSNVFLKVQEASSLRELSHKLKLNLKFHGVGVTGSMDSSSSVEKSSVYVVFVQTLANVGVTENGTPANMLFNNSLTTGDLSYLQSIGQLSSSNLPTYINKVQYGRLMVLRYDTHRSASALAAALEVKYSEQSGSLSTEQKELVKNSSLNVLAMGGPYAAQVALFSGDAWRDYFKMTDFPLTTLKPIGFTLKRWDNRNAIYQTTSKFLKRTCRLGPKIELRVSNRKGDTEVYLTNSSGNNTTIVQQSQDGSDQYYDVSNLMASDLNRLRIRSTVNSYGLFGTSRRDTRVALLVNGSERLVSEDSCGTCHSGDLQGMTVVGSTGVTGR
ncbi:thiol-activated cytolysin family protein [Deinococcus sp. HMF7604]|uniref:thiol-activated cytolysin family protein n=1 Tax=Deinococcus betulae TaxID=2873312 RepID=UPI001CCBD70B|nr:thiol-activated cytolysin family protein [Deinococcus betulae]MBZ9752450.1 thiol-activated cytolysin family protein [Deinococcus betulae]